MPDSIETIRPSRPDDIPLLTALFSEVFGVHRAESVWRWKYFDNPRGCTSYLCEVDGKAVAHCAGLPVRFRDYGSEYVALQSVDFMSSPSYPGGSGRGGVFVRTVNSFFATYCGPSRSPLVYGFPGERHRILGERVLGYRPVERVGELVLGPEEGESEVPAELTARVLHLFTSLPVEYGAIRDETYLRWRYVDHPTKRYGAILAGKRLFGGYEIGAIVGIDDEFVNVMEIAGKLTRNAAGRLAAKLRRFGRPARFWCSGRHPIAQLLVSAGFEPTERDHYVECRYFSARRVPAPGEFYYTLGDYDVY